MKTSERYPLGSLREAFDRAAARYDRHAFLEREVGDRLMERLTFARLEPRRILDLGCGTGHFAAALKRRFRKAEVIGIDASAQMCLRAARCGSWLRPVRAVCADIHRPPLAGQCADLVFSNLALQWTRDFAAAFAAVRAMLRPGGLLLFSLLGPGALRELRTACAAAGLEDGLQPFSDMHDLGDALLAAGFAEPVMDSDTIVVAYSTIASLVADLEATGAWTHVPGWARVAALPARLESAWRSTASDGQLALSWEIVCGAAYGPEEGVPVRTSQGEMAAISVAALRGSRVRR